MEEWFTDDLSGTDFDWLNKNVKAFDLGFDGDLIVADGYIVEEEFSLKEVEDEVGIKKGEIFLIGDFFIEGFTGESKLGARELWTKTREDFNDLFEWYGGLDEKYKPKYLLGKTGRELAKILIEKLGFQEFEVGDDSDQNEVNVVVEMEVWMKKFEILSNQMLSRGSSRSRNG